MDNTTKNEQQKTKNHSSNKGDVEIFWIIVASIVVLALIIIGFVLAKKILNLGRLAAGA